MLFPSNDPESHSEFNGNTERKVLEIFCSEYFLMNSDSTTLFVSTYFSVRLMLGIIALVFPVLLLAGGYLTEGQVLPSISDYYFSSMRDFVVGALVAIGIFLIAYRDNSSSDDRRGESGLGIMAGCAAIGLALFPNKPHAMGIETFFHAVMDDRISVVLHFLSSFVFLTALTVFCLVKFSKDAPARQRLIYFCCGWSIISAGVVATFASFVRAFDWFQAQAFVEDWNLIFWLEALGIWAFCVAWLVKGHSERQSVSPANSRPVSGAFSSLLEPSH